MKVINEIFSLIWDVDSLKIIVAALNTWFSKILLNKTSNFAYPSKEEFIMLDRKHEKYMELYYSICTNPQTGYLYSDEEGKTNLAMFCTNEYKNNLDLYNILSKPLQDTLWSFIRTSSTQTYVNVQKQVEKEYLNLCNRLKRGVVVPKEHHLKYSASDKYQLSAVFSMMFALFSIIFYSVGYLGYIFLTFSILSVCYAYWQYNIMKKLEN